MLSLPTLLSSPPDKPKPVTIQSLTIFPAGQNYPTAQVGAISVSWSRLLAGCVLAAPLHTPAGSRHHSAQSPYQASSSLEM